MKTCYLQEVICLGLKGTEVLETSIDLGSQGHQNHSATDTNHLSWKRKRVRVKIWKTRTKTTKDVPRLFPDGLKPF